MKVLQNFLILFSLALLFTACEANYDETEIVTIEEESKELPTARVTGQVRNMKNETVANATVHVLHKLSVHDVTTDADGWYSIKLPLDHSTVRLQAESDSYSNANIVVQHLLEGELNQDLYLAQAGDMPYEYKNSAAITDSLKTISGYVEYADGKPIIGEVIFLIDLEIYDIASYAVSDENGYFSIAVEPFTDKTLIVTGACSDFEPIIDDFSVSEKDLDLGSIMVDFPSPQSVLFKGTVTNCNTNESLSFGTVLVKIGSKTVEGKIIAGEYSLSVPNCDSETCYDIIIESPLLLDGQIAYDCKEISGMIIENEYELCGSQVIYDGSINIEIDGNSINYETAIASFEGNDWIVQAYDPQTLEQVIFMFPAQGLGEVDVSFFGISDLNNEPIYTAFIGQTQLKINLLQNITKLSGEISGYVINDAKIQVPITGDFSIKL